LSILTNYINYCNIQYSNDKFFLHSNQGVIMSRGRLLTASEIDRVGFWQRRKHEVMRTKKGKGAYSRKKEKRAHINQDAGSYCFQARRSIDPPGKG
jgi:hypothetical protein